MSSFGSPVSVGRVQRDGQAFVKCAQACCHASWKLACTVRAAACGIGIGTGTGCVQHQLLTVKPEWAGNVEYVGHACQGTIQGLRVMLYVGNLHQLQVSWTLLRDVPQVL
jgi:hypothetical protein